MKLKYLVESVVESKESVLQSNFWTNDESEAFNFYTGSVDFYEEAVIKCISIKMLNGEEYQLIKVETH